MVYLRKATAKDQSAIRRLIWHLRLNPMALNWERFLVAVNEQDRVLGCGQVKPHGDGSREMASIAVQPEFQGQGIGRMVIERLLAEHPLPLYLTCRSRMEPYYNRFGFTTLAPEQMPPYFRQLFRLSIFLRKITPQAGELRVMAKTA